MSLAKGPGFFLRMDERQATGMNAPTLRIAYTLTLTAAEYRDAAFMCDRGYLGDIIGEATTEEWADDDSTVVLGFTEPAAWNVQAEQDDTENWYTFWSLTNTSTSLGAKVQTFLDRIV